MKTFLLALTYFFYVVNATTFSGVNLNDVITRVEQQKKRIPIYYKSGIDQAWIDYDYETGWVSYTRTHNHPVPGEYKKYIRKETLYKLPDSLGRVDRHIIVVETTKIIPDYITRYKKKFGTSPLETPKK